MTTALLARVSSEGQRDRHTIDSQKKVLPGIAEAWGLAEPYRWYVDDGVSGASIMDRPAMQDLVRDIRDGEIAAIVMVDQDRLGRPEDLGDWQRIKSLFQQHRVRVFTSSGQIDLDTIDGEFSADLMAILARRERQKIAERAQRGRDHARDAGRWMGGVLPAPYVLIDGKIEVDADMRDQVLETLDYLRTHKRADASRRFNLGQGRVRNMVSAKRLWMYAGYQTNSCGERVPAAWPAIMPESWIHEITLAAAASPAVGARGGAKYLLTGLGLFSCAACGHRMGSHTDSRAARRPYYRCNNRQCDHRRSVVPMSRIDALILARVQSTLDNMDLIKQWQSALDDGQTAQKLTTTESAIQKNKRATSRLVEAITNNVITFADARQKRDHLRTELTTLQTTRTDLIANMRQSTIDLDTSGVTIHDLPMPDQRLTITTLIAAITHHRTHLIITWRVPIDATGNTTEHIALK